MRKRILFEFGTIDIYSEYIVAVMNEGITVKPEYNNELISIAEQYFPDQYFGYITYRKYSYSVDPQIYTETSKIENLAAFAVVADNIDALKNIDVEKIFLKKPMNAFYSLDAAKSWITERIQEKNS